jgi:hypothetical protein
MGERTTETTVTFRRPFRLSCFDAMQPPGDYRLVIDEEEILGLSCIAYQRKATLLHVPCVDSVEGPHKVMQIDSAELANALEADARKSLGLN